MRNGATYSAIVLAGGASRRMGYPKPWLRWDEATTYAERILGTYRALGLSELVLVLNAEFAREPWLDALARASSMASLVLNPDPDAGRMRSIFLGMRAITSDKVFLHNVDSPFVGPEVIQALMRNDGDEQVIIPANQGKGGHPVLVKAAVKREVLAAYDRHATLKDLLGGYTRKYVEVSSPSVLVNINTPADLQHGHGHP